MSGASVKKMPALPLAPLAQAWRFRELLWNMTKRELLARYRGSWLGILWTLITPLLLLLVYVFVFGVIFQARWPSSDGVDGNFTSQLFCGIIVHFALGEILSGSPRLIISNANYVKKVVFPLDLLSWVTVLNTLFHFAISFVVLLCFVQFAGEGISLSVFYAPLLLVVFFPFLLGLCWLLSALSVYVRDVTYVAGFLTTALLFLSPVFYPASAVPEGFAVIMGINPLTFYIEAFRDVAVLGQAPDWWATGKALLIALGVYLFGYWFFKRVERGFADVL